jgi:LysM repeat protein
MPAKGKHRRPRSHRLTRRFAVAMAGTGGAALALPLMGGVAAHAAAHSGPTGVSKTAGTARDATTYTVKPHDTLANIARDQHVSGGWKQLYRANHKVIGHDPNLIHPGQRLTLVGKAHGATSSGATASHAPKRSGAVDAKPADAVQQTGSGYMLPVDGATLGTPYHQAGSMWISGYHTGQDFIVPTGTPVHAVAAGTVVTAGWGGAYGNQVVLQHADGRYTQYGHMSSLNVSAGQTVTEGQQIGVSGATGNATGPHLHFEARTTPDYGSDIDPLAYLRSHGVAV